MSTPIKPSKPKSACPQCGKSYVNVNLHATKSHLRDMWKVVSLPEKRIQVFLFGELIGEDEPQGEIEEEGVEIDEYYFILPAKEYASRPKTAVGVFVYPAQKKMHYDLENCKMTVIDPLNCTFA